MVQLAEFSGFANFEEKKRKSNILIPWSQRLSNWQILRREPLLLIVFIGMKS